MGEWISVKDRLPDTPLQSDRYRYSADVLIVQSGCIFIGSYCSTETSWSEQSGSRASVTHWQPLPAPPEPIAEAETGGKA